MLLFSRPNAGRMFMFASKKYLQEEISKRKIDVSPSCTIDKLIDELQYTNSHGRGLVHGGGRSGDGRSSGSQGRGGRGKTTV